MSVITMKQLLEAGVHFGHQTRRWDPKMKPFIFQERNGIYILDLQQTLKQALAAYDFVREFAVKDKSFLFVGTKKQAADAVREEADRCGMHYINQRWLGGLLTNFSTIRARIQKLNELEAQLAAGEFEKMSKKEAKTRRTMLNKLQKYLGGVKKMTELPDCLFIVDLRKEHIAVAEAKKLNIPTVALVDTNCDPTLVNMPIPGNDDAIRAVKLISALIATAILDGRQASGLEVPVVESAPEEKTEEGNEAARGAAAAEGAASAGEEVAAGADDEDVEGE